MAGGALTETWVTEKLALAGEIVAAYVAIRLRIRRVPLVPLLARLRGGVVDPGIPAGQAAAEHARAVRLARAVRRTLAHVPGDTRCLTQSLVLTALLARRGIGSTMMLAAATGEEFRAHAWVEHGGVPVLPGAGPSLVRLVAL